MNLIHDFRKSCYFCVDNKKHLNLDEVPVWTIFMSVGFTVKGSHFIYGRKPIVNSFLKRKMYFVLSQSCECDKDRTPDLVCEG